MEQEEKPKQEQASADAFKIDIRNILPTIANLYRQFHWIIPLVGLDVPPQVHEALISIAEGKNIDAQKMMQLKAMAETMPRIGEPVLTRQLAEDAWLMHKDGMGTREIAEEFTKRGNPCSHSTVARWINMIDAEKRFSKIARIIRIGKILGFIGIMAIAVLIGKFLL